MDEAIHIFAGSSGRAFALKMCAYLGMELGRSEVISFSEGNTYVKIEEHVRGKELYLVQPIGQAANDDFVELLFWMDAFKRSGARFVTAVIPYFSYAKADKKDEPGVSIRARVCAECIELAGADRVITMDLHAPQVQGFFKKPVDNLFARPLFTEYLRRRVGPEALIVAPDAGGTKNARRIAQALGLPLAVGEKSRACHDEKAEILQVIGDVEGKEAVIVDDFSISGMTLANLARALKRKGARSVMTCLSHVPLSRKGAETLEASEIDKIIATDSVERDYVTGMRKLKLISAAPLFAEAVRRTQGGLSVSELFEDLCPSIIEASLGI